MTLYRRLLRKRYNRLVRVQWLLKQPIPLGSWLVRLAYVSTMLANVPEVKPGDSIYVPGPLDDAEASD